MWLNQDICVVGLHERIYFLKSGDEGILVDCGSEATYPENMRMLKEDGVDAGMISGVLISHEHFDHIAAIGRAKAELGCPIISHRLAAGTIETGDPTVSAAEAGFLGIHVPFLATSVDEVVDEGDEVTLGDTRIEVFHIPGHTPGGAAYLVDGHLLVGDTIFADGRIGWPDIHWGSCLPDHRDSINKIADISPNWLLPGHGEAGKFQRRTTELALEKIDFLERAGVPSINTSPAPRRSSAEKVRSLDISAIQVREGSGKVEPSLRSSLLYEFSTGDLQGFIRPRGHYHGLSLIGRDGRIITKPGLCTLNLEHYCQEGRCAPFLPRTVCTKYHEVSSGHLSIHFTATSEWPLSSTITYSPGPDSTMDVEFEFEFYKSFRAFEAFIASYFQPGKPAYVHTDGGWERPEMGGDEQLFFARDDSCAGQVLDGRWDWLVNAGLRARVSPRRYGSAILVHWDEDSGWAFVQMVDPDLCPSISTNTFANAQDIALVGRDVGEGERIRAKARIIHVKMEEIGEIEEIYEDFLKEVAA